MKKKIIVNSEQSLKNAKRYMTDMFTDKKYLTVTLDHGKARSINQNFVMHGWFAQIAREEMEYTPDQIKSFCKLKYGLPILRADDEQYNTACQLAIVPLVYESKLAALSIMPCTSLMTTVQLTEFMEHIQKHYSGRVKLEFKEK